MERAQSQKLRERRRDRATAPGGVEKAIKIVFGHCSEDLAERELKSLERIRAVRHPFVLSLERFEVVDGRLVIVTELADMSLDACCRQYQETDHPGIPRDELIAYLRDAADALDCLVERHSLQHLDIKPENLLVVGDHVKVGDFGLVKELATRTLNSMMGGMTPLYSAPEVFDDTPSPRSDQYSLAIVYQQMLTGQLPFPGRTPAQLAKQHTQGEPNLQSLDQNDQAVVRKALAKKPEHRFASCREFVAALAAGGVSPTARGAAPTVTPSERAPADNDDTKSSAAIKTHPAQPQQDATPYLVPTSSALNSQPRSACRVPALALCYPDVDESIEDVAFPSFDTSCTTTTPTLFVAVGGLGMTMLRATRARIANANDGELNKESLAYLAIDTDRETLNEAVGDESPSRLQSTDVLHIPLKRPKQYRDGSQSLLRWVSRRWLYNIPRSLETRGYRPLGRIAAVDHAEAVLSELYKRLYQLSQNHQGTDHVRVVLLAGTSGGTGGGVVVDFAQAVRSLADDLSQKVQVDAVLAMPERAAGSAESLSTTNTYSLLTEIVHVQENGNMGHSPPSGCAVRYEGKGPAFDAVYAIAIPPRTSGDDRHQTFSSIGEYLAVEATAPEAALALSACRAATAGMPFRLRSFACTRMSKEQSPEAFLAAGSPAVLRCGYKRYSVAVAPSDSQLPAVLQELRPTLATCKVSDHGEMLLTEATGIDPLAIATRLAEFYPDIADAADRLRTRDDIEWHDLRSNHTSDESPPAPRSPIADPAKDDNQDTIKRAVACE